MFAYRSRTLRLLTAAALLAGAAILTGCVLGNSAEVHRHRSTTVGQELIDLERAKENGLVDEHEYRGLRKNIIKMAEPVELDEDVYQEK